MIRFLLAILVLVIGSSSHAALSCADVRLQPGKEISAPVDQQNTGYCFAAVASELYDSYMLQKTHEVHQTSMTATAIEAVPSAPDKNVSDSGQIWDGLQGIVDIGACPSDVVGESTNGVDKTSAAVHVQDSAYELRSSAVLSNYGARLRACSQKPNQLGKLTIEMQKVLVTMAEEQRKSLAAALDKMCPKDKRQLWAFPLASIKIETIHSESTAASAEQIANALNARTPVGLSLCAFGTIVGESTMADTCGGHAVMIIGSRAAANGGCEYLLRNSWGQGCEAYTKELQKSCKENSGDVWVDAGKTLLRSQSLTWISPE